MNTQLAPSGNDQHAEGARQATTEVFRTLLAYKHTALLRAGIELGVFDALADGSATVAEVAAARGLSQRGARLLLNALVAIELLDETGGRYSLTERSAITLVPGRDGYLGDLSKVLTSRWEWEAMGRLPESVRVGGPVTEENVETPEYEYWEDFANYTGVVTRPTAALMASILHDWAAARDGLDVLDVACGHGLYGYTLAQQHPHARVWSLDNPKVLEIAQKHAARLGVADRVEVLAGDMFTVPLRGRYDLVLVTNVLHHFGEARAQELLRRTASVTAPGGKVVLVGVTVDDGPIRDSAEAHLFSLLMLVWTANGEAHSFSAYERMLTAAGYANMRLYRQPAIPMRVIVADRI